MSARSSRFAEALLQLQLPKPITVSHHFAKIITILTHSCISISPLTGFVWFEKMEQLTSVDFQAWLEKTIFLPRRKSSSCSRDGGA